MKICATEYYSQRGCNANIFCSNEEDVFSVFCLKLLHLVGHSVSFNGSSESEEKSEAL